jgi:drug/metabolite transporter (DMT)-like permease
MHEQWSLLHGRRGGVPWVLDDWSGNRMRRLIASGIFHLLVVYGVWGSTYLAIRIAVGGDGGWGPFWLGGSRTAVAGVALLALAVARGRRIRASLPELAVLIPSALLLWVGGNGGVNWAEQHLDSGLVALIIGGMPLWVALMESLLDRRLPSLLLLLSLVIGFAGLVVLSAPVLRSGVMADALGVLVVVGAAVSWGAGSLMIRRRPTTLGPIVMAGVQQIAGSAGFAVMALAFHEARPQPTGAAWMAFAYLVVFGSVIAFSSYLRALQLLPTPLVMTYTYVNPVIAVFLGWLLLDEPISLWTIGGMALILTGVVGVFRDRVVQREAAVEAERLEARSHSAA